MIRSAGGEFGGAGVHGLEHGVHPQGLAVAANRQLGRSGGPGDLAVGEAQLLELQQGRGGQVG